MQIIPKGSRYIAFVNSIGKGQIILTPQEDNLNGRLVINEEDLQSICIIIGNVPAGELEIITASNTYIASFTGQTSLEEVSNVFAKEIGRQLIFQEELF